MGTKTLDMPGRRPSSLTLATKQTSQRQLKARQQLGAQPVFNREHAHRPVRILAQKVDVHLSAFGIYNPKLRDAVTRINFTFLPVSNRVVEGERISTTRSGAPTARLSVSRPRCARAKNITSGW